MFSHSWDSVSYTIQPCRTWFTTYGGSDGDDGDNAHTCLLFVLIR